MIATGLVFGLVLLGQTSADADVKEILSPYYERDAATYEFFLDDDRQKPLLLRQQPVLIWTNVDHFLGSVFVWTYEGRPEVIGCIGSRQTEAGECFVFHEFHALGTQPLPAAKYQGENKPIWKPARAGLELRDVADAAAPADSARRRLTQMRNLAREFSGAMKDGGDVTELRLLPQPIYRYQSPRQGVADGAIFALVWKGTDPEMLLILEDRQVEEKHRWQYGLARFNWRPMWAKQGEKEVWRVEFTNTFNAPYISSRVRKTSLDAIRRRNDE